MDIPRQRFHNAGFTLIELLVVIAIIGFLFVLAIPTFENAGRKDVNRPAQQFANALRLARQSSIVKRQWTFVVIPTRTNNFSSVADLDKCLRAYAVLASTNLPDSPLKTSFADFKKIFLTDWNYLPNGIYFEERYTASTIGQIGNYPFSSARQVLGSLDPSDPDAADVKLAVLAFSPDGQAWVSSTGANNWANEYPSFYLVSDRYYENDGTRLADPVFIAGTNVRVRVSRQRGGVQVISAEE